MPGPTPPASPPRIGAVDLHWLDQRSQTVLRTPAQLHEISESGLRLTLDHPEPKLMSLLAAGQGELSDEGASAFGPRPTFKVGEVRQNIAGAIRSHFTHQLGELIDAADQSLARRAETEAGVVGEGLYANEARNILRQQREPLIQAFVDDLSKPFDSQRVKTTAEPPRAPQLRLVDDDELHLWLIRSESVSQLENKVRSLLKDISERLARLSELAPEISANALEPEHILNALIRAFKVIDLDYPLRDFLMRLCSHPELLELAKFYARLQTTLGRLGLGPNLTAPAENGSDLGGNAADRPATRMDQTRPTAPPRATVPAAEAIAATQRLWALAQQPPSASSLQLPVASDAQLLQAAADYGSSAGAAGVAENFAEAIRLQAGQGLRMEPRQTEAIELLGRLDEALHLDPLLPGSFRGWSRKLLPALLGTQLGGQDLGEQGDLIKRLFGLLEFGSILCEGRQDNKAKNVREQIGTVIAELANHKQLGSTEIEAACHELEQLLHRQRSAGAAVEERVVEACMGQQRLDEARHQVAKEMGALFGGRKLPQSLAHLLDENLQAAMVLSLLRGGSEGSEWRSDMRLLEDIDSALHDAERGLPIDDADRLTDRIEARLADFPADLPRQQKLIKDLGDSLAGSPLPSVIYRIESDAHKVRQILQTLDDPRTRQIIDQLNLLKPGDWVAFGAETEEPRLLKLAWRSSQRSRFVFVNQLGRKSEDLNRDDLVNLIRTGRGRILDEGNASVIERAWRRMLEGMHDELAQRATHDGLTGLLNRKELDRRLEAWLHQRDRRPLALLWMGVDRLRLLNQSHGMEAGDKVLQAVAKVIEGVLSEYDGAATRIAGDEFVVVIEDLEEQPCLALARQLIEDIGALALEFNGRPLQPSVSIGVALPASDCVDPAQMLSDAEGACRAAKDLGRGRAYLHQKDDLRLVQMRETANWLERVESALRDKALLLYAQRAESLSDAARSRPDYIEVLLRMQGAEGVHTPEQFILAAERYGQIAAVDRFVVQSLVTELSGQPHRRAQIAFNLSSRNIVDEEFVGWLIEQLQGQSFPLDMLAVELTETAAIQQLAEAQRGMNQLHRAGISTVLDDFGSGFSSYRYLKHLPVDLVKVDGAFIRDIANSPEDLALAKSINEIAHLLGKLTVAEHVEDQATLDLIREIGFDYAQGFYIAEPQPLLRAYQAQELIESGSSVKH